MLGRDLDRRDKTGGHLLIAGTGRAGTTLLVQLLSELGFDTGFTAKQARRKVNPVSHAGLEHKLTDEAIADWPYVVKSPRLSVKLWPLLAQKRIAVRAVIVPVRRIADAAASRRRVAEAGEIRGAIWTLRDGQEQEEALLEASHSLLLAIARFELPHVLLHFPRFARQADYAWRRLQPVLAAHGVTEAEFLAAHAACARPERINAFRAAG